MADDVGAVGAVGAVQPDPNVVTIPSSTPEVKPGEPTTGEFKIPDDYQDRTYLKDVESYDDVFKKLDGAQKLIGQRPVGVPGADATPEEVAAFNKAVGVPENFEGYTLTTAEGATKNEVLEKGLKEMFHKANLNQKQVDVLQPSFEELAKNMSTEMATQSDADFDKLAGEVFGEKKEQALADAKKIIAENKPANIENFDKYLEDLSNKDLIVMSAVLNNVSQKYVKEDNIKQDGTQHVGDEASLRQEAVKLMGKPEYADKFHKDHAATFAKVQEIYSSIGKLQKVTK